MRQRLALGGWTQLVSRVTLGVCLGLLGLGAGCGPNEKSAISAGDRAFGSAAPDVRADWEAAVKADRANDYAAAYARLRQLRHPANLTPAQLHAVTALYDSLSARLSAALERGDPAARQAADEIGHMDR